MIIEQNKKSNGLFDIVELYSDSGKKIKELSNGNLWNTDSEHPITIAVSRRNDYIQSDEDIEPFNNEEENINEQDISSNN